MITSTTGDNFSDQNKNLISYFLFPRKQSTMPINFYDISTHNASATEQTLYSPITLSHEWPKLDRLLFMVCCSAISSILNGYFVASFFVETTLKRLGK